MEDRKKLCKKLYLPLKQNNGTLEVMIDSRGKVRMFKSEQTLQVHIKDFDKIGIFTLTYVKNKNSKLNKEEYSTAKSSVKFSVKVR